jgi:hypothetical protein
MVIVWLCSSHLALGKDGEISPIGKKRKDGISAEDVFPSFHFFFDTLPEKKT